MWPYSWTGQALSMPSTITMPLNSQQFPLWKPWQLWESLSVYKRLNFRSHMNWCTNLDGGEWSALFIFLKLSTCTLHTNMCLATIEEWQPLKILPALPRGSMCTLSSSSVNGRAARMSSEQIRKLESLFGKIFWCWALSPMQFFAAWFYGHMVSKFYCYFCFKPSAPCST